MVAAITLNPTHAKVGTSVLITGSGFALTSAVTFTYSGSSIVPTDGPITTDGAGAFTAHITIPASVQGVHPVVATDASLNSGSANFTVDSFISLSPTTQRIGGSTTVIGTGFATLSAVTITIGGITVTGVTTDATGGFTQAETVPTLASGSQTVSATDAALNNATATLTVSAPTLTCTANSGPVGTVTTLSGANYVPNATITITNTDLSTTTTTADATGNIPAGVQITIPDSVHGSNNVTASDGTNTGTGTFSVTSTLVLSPTSGRIGSTFTVTAKGLATASAVTVDFAGTSVTPGGSPTSNAAGTYVGTITVPTKASGARTVTVTDASANAPTATFTVTAPTLALSPTSGIVGTVITLTGANYIPSHALTITNVDGSTSSTTADASGNIPAATTISIASFPKGSHNVTVSDGTNTGTASFTISQSITLDPISGPSTTEVLVTGTGFATTSAITIKVDGVTVTTNPASITSDGTTGAFTGSTTLASLADGAHTISATDASVNTISATFTVSQTLKLTSIINDLNVGRVYKWGENIELEADDTSYADAVVLDTRNAANVLMTFYNAGGQTMDYATYGIIHESNNTVPATDTAGIKKWIPIDVDQSLATTVSGSKLYQNILWSYILVRVKLAAATAATTIEFAAKTIDKNG